MPRVVLSGGPGVGKSAVLHELAQMRHRVFSDSAREIIRERKAVGKPPRPDPVSFAREILARDEVRYDQASTDHRWTFFDRSALEPLGMLHGLGAISEAELRRCLLRFTYHHTVFVLPPWPEIYIQDNERDHPFEHCIRVHAETVSWYTQCGYKVLEVPPSSTARRVEYVLSVLSRSGV